MLNLSSLNALLRKVEHSAGEFQLERDGPTDGQTPVLREESKYHTLQQKLVKSYIKHFKHASRLKFFLGIPLIIQVEVYQCNVNLNFSISLDSRTPKKKNAVDHK